MASSETTDPLSSPLVGAVLAGKYRLEAVLGTGGMATVFAATHRNGGRVAIKVLHERYAQDEGMRARFLREGYAANRVGHPGALRVHDDDVTSDGVVFLVLELLDGETVGRRAARSGKMLSPAVVLAIAYQTLDVLAAAHAQGIVHRDIKPDNLFVSRNGELTVLDFGIARLSEASADARATQTGMTLGTPAFMAPEQALGHVTELSARTDLWALGATLFFLLTGRFVHRGTTPQEVAAYAATRPAPRLGAVSPELSEALCAVVDGALEFEPAARFADAAAMKAAVVRAYAALEGRPLEATSSCALLAFTPQNDISWGASGSTEVLDDSGRSTAGATADPSLASGGPRRRRERRLMTAMVVTAAAALAALLVVVSRNAFRERGPRGVASAHSETSAAIPADTARATPAEAARDVLPPSPPISITPTAALAPPVRSNAPSPSPPLLRPRASASPHAALALTAHPRVDAGLANVEDMYKP